MKQTKRSKNMINILLILSVNSSEGSFLALWKENSFTSLHPKFRKTGDKKKRSFGKSKMSSRAEGFSKSPRWLKVFHSRDRAPFTHARGPANTHKNVFVSPVFTPDVWIQQEKPDPRSIFADAAQHVEAKKRVTVSPCGSAHISPFTPTSPVISCICQHVWHRKIPVCCMCEQIIRGETEACVTVSGLIPPGDHVHHRGSRAVVLTVQANCFSSIKKGAVLINTWIKGL